MKQDLDSPLVGPSTLQNKINCERNTVRNTILAAAQINMGVSLEELGRSSEALAHFKQAIQIEPQKADAHAGLGVALTETGAGNEGLAQVREAGNAAARFST